MDALRMTETILYPGVVIDQDQSQSEPTFLEIRLIGHLFDEYHEEQILLYIDTSRVQESNCIVIYICNKDEKEGYKRYVLHLGHRLSERDEESFVRYLEAESVVYHLEEAVEEINKYMPELNLCIYPDCPKHTVLHLYYSLFPGIREMLFKAKLNHMASSISEMDDINLCSTSPTNLYKGFTMKALRLLNTEWGVKEFTTKEKRDNAAKTYRKYCRWLNGIQHITPSLWKYLKSCSDGTMAFKPRLLKMMMKDQTESGRLYDDYVLYNSKAEIVNNDWYCPAVFTEEQLDRYSTRADLLLMIMEHEVELQFDMDQNMERLSYLDYEDGEYLVRHPSLIKDIVDEAIGQENCLITMVEGIARGWHTVGFMRKAENPEQPFITFELRDNKVTQLLGKYNRRIDKKSHEYKWFEAYVKKKGFSIPEVPRVIPDWDEADIPFV